MPRISNWTPAMYDRLRTLYANYTNKELEVMTGWSVKELQYRAGLIGLKKDKEIHKKAMSKIDHPVELDDFIKSNYERYTNRELAILLGCSIGHVRTRCYAMGLLRMNLEYWTDEQVEYLQANYKHIGDKELSETYQQLWPKNKTWTIKHIEKKRLYLGLKRTKEELAAIHDRNVELGRFKNCPVNRWLKYGVSKEGEIRMWRTSTGRYVPFIKVNGKFRHWARYAWEQANGPVPEGYNVVFKDSPSLTVLENIECISNSELSRRNGVKSNGHLSDNYIAGILSVNQPELRDALKDNEALLALKRQHILLTRAIKKQSNG